MTDEGDEDAEPAEDGPPPAGDRPEQAPESDDDTSPMGTTDDETTPAEAPETDPGRETDADSRSDLSSVDTPSGDTDPDDGNPDLDSDDATQADPHPADAMDRNPDGPSPAGSQETADQQADHRDSTTDEPVPDDANAQDADLGDTDPGDADLDDADPGDADLDDTDPDDTDLGDTDPDDADLDKAGPGETVPAGSTATDSLTEAPDATEAGQEFQDDGLESDTAEFDDDTPAHSPGVPEDVRKYDRFQKIDGGTYERANDFLRERTYITAREWAIARLCADFRTETGVEMTKIGEHLPQLVPFMTDTYTPQAVNQARAAFEEKVRKAGATFLYGAMSDFFTAEELDDVMYEATEVAKFLLEVEGVDLTVEEELEAEDRISEVMREVREHSAALRHGEVTCPECGHQIHTEDG